MSPFRGVALEFGMVEALPERDSLRELLLGYRFGDDAVQREELRFYAEFHASRFRRTLELLPDLPPGSRVLELGAAPFFMTLLLRRYLGFDVTPASFYGDYGEPIVNPRGSATLVQPALGESQRFDYDIFNVERDPYPYADGTFDLVVCCEIVEHLAADPSHMLRECNRVLRQGGRLFLSTPNVASLDNVLRLVRGESIYQSYSADGIYGRHNREYSGPELARLLSAHGFAPDVVIEDAYPHPRWRRLLTAWRRFRRFRDNLFVTGTKQEPAVRRYPHWLYVGYASKHPQAGRSIVMEDQDPSRLGDGWHGYEYWPPGIRWTAGRAAASLRLGDARRPRLGLRLHAGPRGARGTLRVAGRDAGTFSLEANDRAEVRFSIGELLPDAQPGDPIEVELIAETFVPAEVHPGSRDTRRLGVAVESLWTE